MVWLWLALACGGGEEAAVVAEPPKEEPAPAPAPAPAPEAEAAPAPAAGKVFFVEPKDGATVKSPVKIVMGLEGMEVKPAGELAANTGHHHVIIGPVGVDAGTQVPKDETHIHFGQGQTEAEVTLAPGQHQLTLQFADGNHMSYGPGMATTITVTVE